MFGFALGGVFMFITGTIAKHMCQHKHWRVVDESSHHKVSRCKRCGVFKTVTTWEYKS